MKENLNYNKYLLNPRRIFIFVHSSLEMCSEEIHRKVMRQFGGAIAGECYFFEIYL
jgi:hypothetical protein